MEIQDAIDLIRDAVGSDGTTWADLGAGTGTFTAALAELLGPDATIYAVDEDAHAVRALRELSASTASRIVVVGADFTRAFGLPGLGDALLDGILLANALHFVRDAAVVLARLVERVRVGGRVVVVEYDRRQAGRWVPYPIPAGRWPELAASAGLVRATITATQPSIYAGVLYVGAALKASSDG